MSDTGKRKYFQGIAELERGQAGFTLKVEGFNERVPANLPHPASDSTLHFFSQLPNSILTVISAFPTQLRNSNLSQFSARGSGTVGEIFPGSFTLRKLVRARLIRIHASAMLEAASIR